MPSFSQTINKSELETFLNENNIPALGLGIITNGELSKIEVYGQLDSGQKAPYNTIFNVASVTKPVTAMVALKLVSQGKWNLDEPLYKFWIDKDIENDKRAKIITTRHLISHQSGFPNWREGKLKFLFEPGTQYQYSGEGFEYLRKALESKFNKTLNQLAKELIFDPLKMEDTQYIWNENIDASRVAKGYDKVGNSYPTHQRKINNGADDLLTTIKDYSTFLISAINSEGLSEEVFNDMITDQTASLNGKHYGLGFEKYHFKDGNYALTHGGADYGAHAMTIIFPETKQGLLIFTNADNGYKTYFDLLPKYLGKYGTEILEIETGEKITIPEKITPYTSSNQKLYDEILSLDKQFFEAYNTCNLKKQEDFYSNDIEFFHDKAGLMTSKKAIIASTQKYICGKVTRELLQETVEVYPIAHYGAIEIGYHKFHNSAEANSASKASKFIIVWNNTDEDWKIDKVISIH